jgi:hypothetical protein
MLSRIRGGREAEPSGRDPEPPFGETESALGVAGAEPDSGWETERDWVAADCSELGEALLAPLGLDAEVMSEVTGFTRE